MKTLLMLGILGQEHISFERELPSFAETFVLKKQTSLERLLAQKERKIQQDAYALTQQYEYTLLKEKNYEIFLFGRATETFQYGHFEQYSALGIAFRIEF